MHIQSDPAPLRIDGASLFVISLTFVLPLLLSIGVHRWWAKREWAQQQKARQQGKVFPIIPFYRSSLLFVIFALSAVCLLMLASGINEARTNVRLESGIVLTLLFLPIILGCLFFLLHNTGLVLLTHEGIHVQRWGRRHFLRYSDITAVRFRNNPLVAALLVHSAERTLRIPWRVRNLFDLYELLRSRVEPTVRDATLG